MVRYNIKATKTGYPSMDVTAEQKKVILGIVDTYLEHGYSSIVLTDVE